MGKKPKERENEYFDCPEWGYGSKSFLFLFYRKPLDNIEDQGLFFPNHEGESETEPNNALYGFSENQ